ncbi:MAG: low specificity L-threonine aldolase [Acidobacteria bacterium]|nr:low specificity L-threonine aldolase [Acidobacteriota bacterium]MYJ04054.1 low specificity L-threonine aldolase [Acidobacteriota bacterium]
MPACRLMSNRVVSLYSDTETRPTEGMRAAIAAAKVGDEQKNADPTVLALQERVAGLLGKEAALWMPTGTMCNLTAIRTHTRPGDAIVADWMAHIVRAESGGSALASGVTIEPIRTARGIFTPDEAEAAIARATTVPTPYGQPVSLVCVEQTHNFGGGAVWPLDALREVSGAVRGRGIAMHMDGARLMNASVAAGAPAADFAACVDSVWIDFTKGLGAPIGAVLAGSKEFIQAARRFKQLFGGAMRQAGIAAAGCLYALDHHVERLADDHANARRLATGLAEIPSITLRTPEPETNMIFFAVDGLRMTAAEFAAKLKAAGVLMSGAGGYVRAVTHLDVSRDDIDRALAVIRGVAASGD